MATLRVLLLALLLPLGAALAATAGPKPVLHPQPRNDVDRVCVEVLQLALSKAPGSYAARAWPVNMERGRAVSELAQGRHLDVLWAVTSRERERQMLPIRIPLDKGLSGWRLALIKRDDSEAFSAIQQLSDLAAYKAGQGVDWAETPVLRANGLPVVTGTNSNSLHAMLAARRFDYFPRPVRQAWLEAEEHPDSGLVVESGFVLHFPSALYFFVNKNNQRLAAALEGGLRAAMADGSFEQLFQQQNAAFLQRSNLGKRRIFELKNPDLPLETPLDVKSYWYAPEH